MNLVLLERHELAVPLPPDDARTRHVTDVLRRAVGDRFDAGVVDGPIGQATVVALGRTGLTFTFKPEREPPPLPDLHLVVGLPRPSTARDILRDATTCGVRSLQFVCCERTQASYAQSSLWTSGEWRRHLLLGAAQAFDTRIPEVTWGHALETAIAAASTRHRLALDNYEAATHLAAHGLPTGPITLAVGPERGWGPHDRQALRAGGFVLHHLGVRVLRVEMAVVAATVLLRAER